MKKWLVTGLMVVMTMTTLLAQDSRPKGDPKQITERAARALKFTDAQNDQLKKLNDRYTGDNYDKRKYREEFRAIMTDEQRQKADDMRAKRQGMKEKNKE